MKTGVRTIVAVGFLGCATLGIVPLGCGNSLGPVLAREYGPKGKSPMPARTIERLQECMAEYGGQLEPKTYLFSPTVEIDQNGVAQAVATDDIPVHADDFAACTRVALGAMAIPEGVLRLARMQATAGQRSYMGSPAIVVIVVVGLSEIALEAGAYTFLFAVTVKVVEKAKDDVLEAVKRRRMPWENECQRKLTECLLSSLGSQWGDVHGTSRCAMCFKRCDKSGWPSRIQIDDDVYATCIY